MWRQSTKSIDDIPPTLIKKWLPDTFFSLCQISISPSHILNFPLSHHTMLYCTILYYICLLSDLLPSYTFNSFHFPPLFRLSLPSRMTSRHTYRTETQNLPEYFKTLSVVIQRQSLSSLCLHQGVSSEIETKERHILCGHLITYMQRLEEFLDFGYQITWFLCWFLCDKLFLCVELFCLHHSPFPSYKSSMSATSFFFTFHSFNAPESLSTCRFGVRAKSIENKVTVNQSRSPEELGECFQ